MSCFTAVTSGELRFWPLEIEVATILLALCMASAAGGGGEGGVGGARQGRLASGMASTSFD